MILFSVISNRGIHINIFHITLQNKKKKKWFWGAHWSCLTKAILMNEYPLHVFAWRNKKKKQH